MALTNSQVNNNLVQNNANPQQQAAAYAISQGATNQYGQTQSQYNQYQAAMQSLPEWQRVSPLKYEWQRNPSGMPPSDSGYVSGDFTPSASAISAAQAILASNNARDLESARLTQANIAAREAKDRQWQIDAIKEQQKVAADKNTTKGKSGATSTNQGSAKSQGTTTSALITKAAAVKPITTKLVVTKAAVVPSAVKSLAAAVRSVTPAAKPVVKPTIQQQIKTASATKLNTDKLTISKVNKVAGMADNAGKSNSQIAAENSKWNQKSVTPTGIVKVIPVQTVKMLADAVADAKVSQRVASEYTGLKDKNGTVINQIQGSGRNANGQEVQIITPVEFNKDGTSSMNYVHGAYVTKLDTARLNQQILDKHFGSSGASSKLLDDVKAVNSIKNYNTVAAFNDTFKQNAAEEKHSASVAKNEKEYQRELDLNTKQQQSSNPLISGFAKLDRIIGDSAHIMSNAGMAAVTLTSGGKLSEAEYEDLQRNTGIGMDNSKDYSENLKNLDKKYGNSQLISDASLQKVIDDAKYVAGFNINAMGWAAGKTADFISSGSSDKAVNAFNSGMNALSGYSGVGATAVHFVPNAINSFKNLDHIIDDSAKIINESPKLSIAAAKEVRTLASHPSYILPTIGYAVGGSAAGMAKGAYEDPAGTAASLLMQEAGLKVLGTVIKETAHIGAYATGIERGSLKVVEQGSHDFVGLKARGELADAILDSKTIYGARITKNSETKAIRIRNPSETGDVGGGLKGAFATTKTGDIRTVSEILSKKTGPTGVPQVYEMDNVPTVKIPASMKQDIYKSIADKAKFEQYLGKSFDKLTRDQAIIKDASGKVILRPKEFGGMTDELREKMIKNRENPIAYWSKEEIANGKIGFLEQGGTRIPKPAEVTKGYIPSEIEKLAQEQANVSGKPVAYPAPKSMTGDPLQENEMFFAFPESDAGKFTKTAFAGITKDGAIIRKVSYGSMDKPQSFLKSWKENIKHNYDIGIDRNGIYNKSDQFAATLSAVRRDQELITKSATHYKGSFETGAHGVEHAGNVEKNLNSLNALKDIKVDTAYLNDLARYHDITKIGAKDLSYGGEHAVSGARAIRSGELPGLKGKSQAYLNKLAKDISQHTEIKPLNVKNPIKGLKTSVLSRPSEEAKMLANADRMDLPRFKDKNGNPIVVDKKQLFKTGEPTNFGKLKNSLSSLDDIFKFDKFIRDEKAQLGKTRKIETKNKVQTVNKEKMYEYKPKPEGYKLKPSEIAPYKIGEKVPSYKIGEKTPEYKLSNDIKKGAAVIKKEDPYSEYKPRAGGYVPKPEYKLFDDIKKDAAAIKKEDPYNEYKPRTDGYIPKPGGYVPKPGGYTPKPGGYVPKPGGYTPKPGGYVPGPGGYIPKPGGYVPKPGGYIPKPGGYTASTAYGPGVTRQEPTPKKKVLMPKDKKLDAIKKREDAVTRSHRLIQNELVNLQSFIG